MVRVHFYPVEGARQDPDGLVGDLRRKFTMSGLQTNGQIRCDISKPLFGAYRPEDIGQCYVFISSCAEDNGYEARNRFGRALE